MELTNIGKALLSKSVMVVMILSLSVVAQSGAATVDTETSTQASVESAGIAFTGRVGVGYLTGKATEYMYGAEGEGYTASELTWKIDSLYMVGLGATIQPLHWLGINVDTWFNIGDGDGYMQDYDWMEETIQDWTHVSFHDSTSVKKGFIFDVNAEMTAFTNDKVRLTGILGFRRDNFEWEARGGTYTYSVNGFRNTSGTSPDGQLMISYEQTFEVPYMGIGIEGDFDRVHLGVKLIGSIFVSGQAIDHHHLRNLVVYDNFSNENMWGVDVAFGYDINDRIGIETAYKYVKYDTTGKPEFQSETPVDVPDVIGADLYVSMVSVALIYSF